MPVIKKPVNVIRCTYTETDELRDFKVMDLEGLPEVAINALYKIGCFTVGEVLDNWSKIPSIKGIGKVRVRHIKAAVFAQICEMGLLKDADVVTL